MHSILLTLHLLSATIWIGGHLILALALLPDFLRHRDVNGLHAFESKFERIGIPALIIQIITGFGLSHLIIPNPIDWLDWSNPIARPILLKLFFLFTTIAFALDARLRIIPKLTPARMTTMAWHIIPVTLLSVLFALAGISFRTGWLF